VVSLVTPKNKALEVHVQNAALELAIFFILRYSMNCWCILRGKCTKEHEHTIM